MNIYQTTFACKVLVCALVLPMILPVGVFGEQLSYSRNTYVDQVKDEFEIRSVEITREEIEIDESPIESLERKENERNQEVAGVVTENVTTVEGTQTTDTDNKKENRNRTRKDDDRRNQTRDTTSEGVFGGEERTVSVSVHKFLDGVAATSNTAQEQGFDMVAMYSDITEQYVLGPDNPDQEYQWNMLVPAGQTFSTHEILNNEDSTSAVYESVEACQAACPADFNHDGTVDGFDLAILLDNWGAEQTEENQALLGDVDADVDIDGADLASLLGAWGPCKPSFVLAGYSVGDSFNDAVASGPMLSTAPEFTTDTAKTLIVWNTSCYAQPQVLSCDPDVNLLANADFEDKQVTHGAQWDVFNVNEGVGWVVGWIGGAETYENDTRPRPAKLEIQSGVNGWTAFSGSQYAELDTDWGGPDSGVNLEPASVKIYQDVLTIPGQNYKLSYNFSPRPGTSEQDNMLEVSINDATISTWTASGADQSNTVWSSDTTVFEATSPTTRIQFADIGNPDSLGTFVDNVSLTCVPEDSGDGDPVNDDEDEGGVAGSESASSGGGGSKKKISGDAGNVLGAATQALGDVLGAMTCEPYINSYIKYGANNNAEDVRRLQAFLNKFQGANLPVTGFYGPMTKEAVNKFQLFHNMFVLRPWVMAGLMSSDTVPTGYVYKTTRRWINLLECPTLGTPMPDLRSV